MTMYSYRFRKSIRRLPDAVEAWETSKEGWAIEAAEAACPEKSTHQPQNQDETSGGVTAAHGACLERRRGKKPSQMTIHMSIRTDAPITFRRFGPWKEANTAVEARLYAVTRQ